MFCLADVNMQPIQWGLKYMAKTAKEISMCSSMYPYTIYSPCHVCETDASWEERCLRWVREGAVVCQIFRWTTNIKVSLILSAGRWDSQICSLCGYGWWLPPTVLRVVFLEKALDSWGSHAPNYNETKSESFHSMIEKWIRYRIWFGCLIKRQS